eukprot:1156271-Pelagomonas_calceolata.AAC.13
MEACLCTCTALMCTCGSTALSHSTEACVPVQHGGKFLHMHHACMLMHKHSTQAAALEGAAACFTSSQSAGVSGCRPSLVALVTPLLSGCNSTRDTPCAETERCAESAGEGAHRDKPTELERCAESAGEGARGDMPAEPCLERSPEDGRLLGFSGNSGAAGWICSGAGAEGGGGDGEGAGRPDCSAQVLSLRGGSLHEC